MGRFEKSVIVIALCYLAIYLPFFFHAVHDDRLEFVEFAIILPFHLVAMCLNLLVLILTIRDLYLRPFEKPNAKLTWGLLIISTGGIGLIVYLFKHALKPRSFYEQNSSKNPFHEPGK